MMIEDGAGDNWAWHASAAAIAAWARANEVPARVVESSPYCAELFERAGTANPVFQEVTPQSVASLKAVERVFETSLDADHKRLEGAVYTPEYVIDYLVKEALALRGGNGKATRMLDPACGAGGFLMRAAQILAAQDGRSMGEVIHSSIFGIDKNPRAHLMTGALLELLMIQAGENPADSSPNLQTGDSLLPTPGKLMAEFGVPDGFDVVATNPPYVKLQNLPDAYRAKLLARFEGLAKGSFSLALLFLIQCHQLLAERGVAAMITQNNLFTSLAGTPIRQYLQTAGSLRRLIDFGDSRVFEDASAYTCLVFIGSGSADTFEFGATEGIPSAKTLDGTALHRIPTADLNPKKWRLGSKADLNNLRKLETIGRPLGELCDIHVGFATLKDKVFFLNSDGIGSTPSGKTIQIELDLRRDAIKVADAKCDTDLVGKRRQILFPYRHGEGFLFSYGRGEGLIDAVPEGELRESYPNAYEYLVSWRQELASRDKGKEKQGNWYEWGRRQALEAPGPKLLTKTFNNHPQFFLDASDALFCNGYSLKPRVGGWPSSIELLRMILESDVMNYYAHLTSFQIEGGYQCYQKNFISPFCIPEIDEAVATEIFESSGTDRQELISKLFGLDHSQLLSVIDR